MHRLVEERASEIHNYKLERDKEEMAAVIRREPCFCWVVWEGLCEDVALKLMAEGWGEQGEGRCGQRQ